MAATPASHLLAERERKLAAGSAATPTGEYRMSDLIARLERLASSLGEMGRYDEEDTAREAVAQLSALRDQQPVAWLSRGGLTGTAYLTEDVEQAMAWHEMGCQVEPLYAHPSCVYPDQQQEK